MSMHQVAKTATTNIDLLYNVYMFVFILSPLFDMLCPGRHIRFKLSFSPSMISSKVSGKIDVNVNKHIPPRKNEGNDNKESFHPEKFSFQLLYNLQNEMHVVPSNRERRNALSLISCETITGFHGGTSWHHLDFLFYIVYYTLPL